MSYIKLFKEYILEQQKQDQYGYPVALTSEEDITNYYRCNDCGNMYHLFNEISSNCPKCRKNNLTQLTSFDFFTELKNGDKGIYTKELKLQKERGDKIVDLINLEYIKRGEEYKKNIN